MAHLYGKVLRHACDLRHDEILLLLSTADDTGINLRTCKFVYISVFWLMVTMGIPPSPETDLLYLLIMLNKTASIKVSL